MWPCVFTNTGDGWRPAPRYCQIIAVNWHLVGLSIIRQSRTKLFNKYSSQTCRQTFRTILSFCRTNANSLRFPERWFLTVRQQRPKGFETESQPAVSAFALNSFTPNDATERQSARMSKITSDGLTWFSTWCFIAVPKWQQWALKG